tara:strand:- start:1190 stop:1528 length:339 start_codon:yes stop_codon:yes gene_type:complete
METFINNLKIVNDYFDNFSKKDLSALEKQIDDDIILHDWVLKVQGKLKVMETFKSIFEENESIKISPVNIMGDQSCFSAEILITINNKEILEVVDVLKIKDNKIISIKAYKC